MSAEKHDLSLMTLHVGDVIGLFIYYAIMLLGSLGITIEQIAKTSAIADMGQFDAILTVLSSSVCGSTIFYSRKL